MVSWFQFAVKWKLIRPLTNIFRQDGTGRPKCAHWPRFCWTHTTAHCRDSNRWSRKIGCRSATNSPTVAATYKATPRKRRPSSPSWSTACGNFKGPTRQLSSLASAFCSTCTTTSIPANTARSSATAKKIDSTSKYARRISNDNRYSSSSAPPTWTAKLTNDRLFLLFTAVGENLLTMGQHRLPSGRVP